MLVGEGPFAIADSHMWQERLRSSNEPERDGRVPNNKGNGPNNMDSSYALSPKERRYPIHVRVRAVADQVALFQSSSLGLQPPC